MAKKKARRVTVRGERERERERLGLPLPRDTSSRGCISRCDWSTRMFSNGRRIDSRDQRRFGERNDTRPVLLSPPERGISAGEDERGVDARGERGGEGRTAGRERRNPVSPKDEKRRSGTTTKPVLIIIFIFRHDGANPPPRFASCALFLARRAASLSLPLPRGDRHSLSLSPSSARSRA